jgi:hypothetical protein
MPVPTCAVKLSRFLHDAAEVARRSDIDRHWVSALVRHSRKGYETENCPHIVELDSAKAKGWQKDGSLVVEI